jgi:hypothetical protein
MEIPKSANCSTPSYHQDDPTVPTPTQRQPPATPASLTAVVPYSRILKASTIESATGEIAGTLTLAVPASSSARRRTSPQGGHRLFPRVAVIALQQQQPGFLHQRIAADLDPIAIRHMQNFR